MYRWNTLLRKRVKAMVINPFLFGVLTTLFVEMVILIITSLITSNKREKDETAKEVD